MSIRQSVSSKDQDGICITAGGFTCQYKSSGKIFGPFEYQISKGQIVGLIGQNGAGKTTMIRSMVGLGAKPQGPLHLFGRKPGDQVALRKIFYLPEKVSFIRPISAELNARIVLGANIFNSRFYELCERLGIEKDLRRPVQEFSKGMTQKLALACAFASPAECLILDEPLSGLDPDARLKVRDLILEYKQDRCFLISSHLHTDLVAQSTDVLVISDAKQIWWSKTAEFLQFIDDYRMLVKTGDSLKERLISRQEKLALFPQIESGSELILVEPLADSLKKILAKIEGFNENRSL